MRNTILAILILVPASFLPFSGWGQITRGDSIKVMPVPYIEGNIGAGLSARTLFMPSSNTVWMDYVKPGLCTGINGEIPLFHSHFGIRGAWCYYYNGFNMNKYVASQQAGIASSTVTPVSYGAFTQYTFSGGAFASFTFTKLTIELSTMAGGCYCFLPNTEINVTISSPGQSQYTSTVVYKTNLAFEYGGGAEAAYKLHKRLSVSVSLDCLFATVPYTNTRYDDYIQHINYEYNYSGKAQVFMFLAKAGLRYSFGE